MTPEVRNDFIKGTGDKLKWMAVKVNSRSMKEEDPYSVPCFQILFGCVRVYVYSDPSCPLEPRFCFLPSLKWVVGVFQNLSITQKDEEEEKEEEAERSTFAYKTGNMQKHKLNLH